MAEQAFRIKNTTATRKIFQLRKRIRAVAGGSGASKTISILIWCIDYAQSTKNELISIVSENYPHLERGAMLDFETIMKDRGYWKDSEWHDTKHTYSFPSGSKIEFVAVDSYGKAHGPRRDVLFMNECNNIPYNIARQLVLRTRKIVWMDWNPSADFWYYSEFEGKRDDIDFLKLTYLDNEGLDTGERSEIESLRSNRYLWQVYGLGELGEIEGKIFNGWKQVDEVPHDARLISYGLDFGYQNDPTALVAIYYLNNGYIVDEILYQKGLHNNQIADILKVLPSAIVIADAAEPKSIDEMRLYGISMLPSTKGKGAVSQRIAFVQEQRISYTKRSVNIKKEYNNYVWKTDKNGNIIPNEPEHAFSHSMDAIGYGLQIKFPKEPMKVYQQPAWESPGLA